MPEAIETASQRASQGLSWEASRDYATRVATFESQRIKQLVTNSDTLVRGVRIQNLDVPLIVQLFETHRRITIACFPILGHIARRGLESLGSIASMNSRLHTIKQKIREQPGAGRAVGRMVFLVLERRQMEDDAKFNRVAMLGER